MDKKPTVEENVSLGKEVEEKQARLNTIMVQVANMRTQNDEWQKEIEATKQEKEQLAVKYAQYKKDVETLGAQVEQLMKDRDATREEIKKLDQDRADTQTKRDAARKELTEVEAKVLEAKQLEIELNDTNSKRLSELQERERLVLETAKALNEQQAVLEARQSILNKREEGLMLKERAAA